MLDTILISCSVICISVDLVRSMQLSHTDLHYTEILALVPLWDKCLIACGNYFTEGIMCTLCYPCTMYKWKRG